MRQLTDANYQQRDEPLVEILGLLSTLLEGWEGVQRLLESKPLPQTPSQAPWAQVQETAYTPQAWNCAKASIPLMTANRLLPSRKLDTILKVTHIFCLEFLSPLSWDRQRTSLSSRSPQSLVVYFWRP